MDDQVPSKRLLSLPKHEHLIWRSHRFLFNWYRGLLFRGTCVSQKSIQRHAKRPTQPHRHCFIIPTNESAFFPPLQSIPSTKELPAFCIISWSARISNSRNARQGITRTLVSDSHVMLRTARKFPRQTETVQLLTQEYEVKRTC